MPLKMLHFVPDRVANNSGLGLQAFCIVQVSAVLGEVSNIFYRWWTDHCWSYNLEFPNSHNACFWWLLGIRSCFCAVGSCHLCRNGLSVKKRSACLKCVNNSSLHCVMRKLCHTEPKVKPSVSLSAVIKFVMHSLKQLMTTTVFSYFTFQL